VIIGILQFELLILARLNSSYKIENVILVSKSKVLPVFVQSSFILPSVSIFWENSQILVKFN